MNRIMLSVILTSALVLVMFGATYRWEEVELLGFNIKEHANFMDSFYDCDSPKECGWEYYRDRLTGLTKARHVDMSGLFTHISIVDNEFDQYLIIYEKPVMKYINAIIDTIIYFLMGAVVFSFILVFFEWKASKSQAWY